MTAAVPASASLVAQPPARRLAPAEVAGDGASPAIGLSRARARAAFALALAIALVAGVLCAVLGLLLAAAVYGYGASV